MSWWNDKNNNCSYDEWVKKFPELVPLLDEYFGGHPDQTVLEFGSGNSTRVLAYRCKKVITVDINPISFLVPTAEQNVGIKEMAEWAKIEKEGNVEFICGDVLRMDFNVFKDINPDAIVFDVGTKSEDKYLYRICYDRLKASGAIDKQVLFIDNANTPDAENFIEHLKTEGYEIETIKNQAIARKAQDGS